MNETAFSIKYFGSFITALICNAFLTIAPLAVLCFVLVIIDCITSWRLSCRLRQQGKSSGKFRSDKFGRAVIEMSIVIPVALLIAHFVQLYIFEGSNFHLPQITAGVICFWQIWSILENMSSGGRVPRLQGVKGFDGVLIHCGNTAEDSSGCILVGYNTVKGMVTNSKDTFRRLYEIIAKADSVFLTIE